MKNDYRQTVELATARVGRLTARLAERVATWDEAMLVTALQALRGVDLVTAATLVAEIGDFRRFASASELMAFVGLVPSKHSSGGAAARAGSRGRATAMWAGHWWNRRGTIDGNRG